MSRVEKPIVVNFYGHVYVVGRRDPDKPGYATCIATYPCTEENSEEVLATVERDYPEFDRGLWAYGLPLDVKFIAKCCAEAQEKKRKDAWFKEFVKKLIHQRNAK